MKYLLTILFFGLTLLLYSCNDKGTAPLPVKSVRDYTWSADTLAYQGSAQTLMRSIWGSSSNNIYICGHNDQNRGHLWRYDGSAWTAVDIFNDVERGPVSLSSVYGSSENNVWVVGARETRNPNPPPNFLSHSFIIQFDGIAWREHKVNTDSRVYDVYANSPDDVWACGTDGIVYHYDGSDWEKDTIAVDIKDDEIFSLYDILIYDSRIYMLGFKSKADKSQSVYYFLTEKDNKWFVIDTFEGYATSYNWGSNSLYVLDQHKLYSYGVGGIYKWEHNFWEKIFSLELPLTGMADQGKNDMLTVSIRGNARHFNGENWAQLEALNFENIHYTGAWMDNDEAFVMGHDLESFPQKTIIYHGK